MTPDTYALIWVQKGTCIPSTAQRTPQLQPATQPVHTMAGCSLSQQLATAEQGAMQAAWQAKGSLCHQGSGTPLPAGAPAGLQAFCAFLTGTKAVRSKYRRFQDHWEQAGAQPRGACLNLRFKVSGTESLASESTMDTWAVAITTVFSRRKNNRSCEASRLVYRLITSRTGP